MESGSALEASTGACSTSSKITSFAPFRRTGPGTYLRRRMSQPLPATSHVPRLCCYLTPRTFVLARTAGVQQSSCSQENGHSCSCMTCSAQRRALSAAATATDYQAPGGAHSSATIKQAPERKSCSHGTTQRPRQGGATRARPRAIEPGRESRAQVPCAVRLRVAVGIRSLGRAHMVLAGPRDGQYQPRLKPLTKARPMVQPRTDRYASATRPSASTASPPTCSSPLPSTTPQARFQGWDRPPDPGLRAAGNRQPPASRREDSAECTNKRGLTEGQSSKALTALQCWAESTQIHNAGC